MASGSGRPSDPAADDPSIIGISNAHHGNSGRQSNQRNHPLSHPGAGRQRHQAHQQTRRQYHQQQQTPTSSEKQRLEHWKVPPGNSHQSPLAKDLFGAENNPQFQFDSQGYDNHQGNRSHNNHHYGGGYQQQKPGGRYGGRSNQNYGKHNKGPLGQEGQGSSQASKVGHRQHNGGTLQQEQGGKNAPVATPKPKPSAPSQIETERQVQYIETLMKNGEKSANLTITVTGKTNEKKGRKESKPAEKGPKPPMKSMLEDAIKSPANKFSNPLMETKPAENETASQTVQNAMKDNKKPVDDKKNENKAGNAVGPETQSMEQPEKKKKKRNREKKRKKDKSVTDEKQKLQESSGQSNQNLSKTSEKPVAKDVEKSQQVCQTATASENEKAGTDNARTNSKSEPQSESAGGKENKSEESLARFW